MNELTALSPIDGRYAKATKPLRQYLSEAGLIRARVRVECAYLLALADEPALPFQLTDDERALLQQSCDKVSEDDVVLVKRIETEGVPAAGGREAIPATRHDVKAVEYFIKKKLAGTSLEAKSEWVHFGLTSEDVNSVAYGLMLRDAFEHAMLPGLLPVYEKLKESAKTYAALPMLARTHGQPASPTTFGKEMEVFVKRLERQVDALKVSSILVKFGGATGNWNAHQVAFPKADWPAFATRFVESLNAEGEGKKHFMRLEHNPFTTQIEPHDTYAELFDAYRRTNTILTDLAQDIWRYISDGWLVQEAKAGEIGSSAMPHKVNPIDFENAEGNFGIANALLEFFSRKLPVSRLQRDLSDSTVERNFGVALAHTLVGYASLAKGLERVRPDEAAFGEALAAHPEVLAEAIQTILRREGVEGAYEKLKDLMRGKKVSMMDIKVFIESLDVSEDVRKELLALTPEGYTGLAEQLAKGK
ncbi:MAG: adenylosuccinate lyase [Patescibacteria group bacterium]|nr:adenylosuccinate lyase [Patescibacteria group bacterium]MDE1965863.1 adenylosuccinate lyase [Patescibacteria group bacterium]